MLVSRIITAFIATGLLFPGLIVAGDLEPSDPPGPTMHTLEQIYQKPVWRIMGLDFMTWPNNSRFKVSYDGYILPGFPNWGNVVIDQETGLMWARNPKEFPVASWGGAMQLSRNSVISDRKGWRLPAAEEIATLVDVNTPVSPKLPAGHPFLSMLSGQYWTCTTYEGDSNYAYYFTSLGELLSTLKTSEKYMWLVRGGAGCPSGN